jgi:hypothetical protein
MDKAPMAIGTCASAAEKVSIVRTDTGSGHVFIKNDAMDFIDLLGMKTAVYIVDPDYENFVAGNAAIHFQKAGWTVVFQNANDFQNRKTAFEGIIMSGHGDETESGGMTVEAVEGVLKRCNSKLDVALALSCHGFDVVSKMHADGYTTSSALLIGYWGYAMHSCVKQWKIDSVIDDWAKNPRFESFYYGNLVMDGGASGYFIAVEATIENRPILSIPAL